MVKTPYNGLKTIFQEEEGMKSVLFILLTTAFLFVLYLTRNDLNSSLMTIALYSLVSYWFLSKKLEKGFTPFMLKYTYKDFLYC